MVRTIPGSRWGSFGIYPQSNKINPNPSMKYKESKSVANCPPHLRYGPGGGGGERGGRIDGEGEEEGEEGEVRRWGRGGGKR